jgi:ankyrin repeat protein
VTADDGTSCLHISAQEGHLEEVNALLEAGGRELLMLTYDVDGSSWACGCGERAAGGRGREMLMMTADNGASCLMVGAQNGHLEVVRALLEAGGRELLMMTADN